MLVRQAKYRSSARHRNSKVYIPANARENHYVVARINVLSLALEAPKLQQKLFREMAKTLFSLCEQEAVTNVCFLACDKRVKVRFADEFQMLETRQQIIVLYSPEHDAGHRALFEVGGTGEVQLVFLSHGQHRRENAATFHHKITRLLETFTQTLGVDSRNVVIEDRQHLTFDALAKHKGEKATQTHHFRYLTERYRQQAFIVPDTARPLAYGVAKLMLTDSVIGQYSSSNTNSSEVGIFKYLKTLFENAVKGLDLHSAYMVASDKNIVVSQAEENGIEEQAEMVLVGISATSGPVSIDCLDPAHEFVNCIQFVLVANYSRTEKSHGKLVNGQIKALEEISQQLNLNKATQAFMFRFYQSIAYTLSPDNK